MTDAEEIEPEQSGMRAHDALWATPQEHDACHARRQVRKQEIKDGGK